MFQTVVILLSKVYSCSRGVLWRWQHSVNCSTQVHLQ
jgi:hypothetical protein